MMAEDSAVAVDLHGTGPQVATEKRAERLKETWIVLRRSRKFWLLLVCALVVVPTTCASFVYAFKSERPQADNKPEILILKPESALHEQLLALQLSSPWHDNAVGADQVCSTSECVQAASHLLFGINHAADPCDDFYDFACANWIKLYKDQGLAYNSHSKEMFISEDKLVEEILARSPESYNFQPMKTTALFLHQCVNEGRDHLFCHAETMGFFDAPVMHEYFKTKSNLQARPVMDQMTANLLATFHKILESNNWLSDAAKLTTQKKLSALKTFIGYPNWLLNTTEIESRFQGIHLGSNFIETWGNALHASNDQLAREPNFFRPSSTQASYSPLHNSLVIPMRQIQPHVFYNNIPNYVNYGRMGAVIGHEISHGFDARNKNLDEKGQFRDRSWADEDKQNYEEKSNCYVDQYNKFEILPGIYVNGSACLDENIADNNGMKIAYITYRDHYAGAHNDDQSLPGFEKLSGEQLFFLSYGSLRCEYGDEATKKHRALVDPHSPAKYRTNGVLQNSAEFAEAWNCPVGSPMNPVNKCTLW